MQTDRRKIDQVIKTVTGTHAIVTPSTPSLPSSSSSSSLSCGGVYPPRQRSAFPSLFRPFPASRSSPSLLSLATAATVAARTAYTPSTPNRASPSGNCGRIVHDECCHLGNECYLRGDYAAAIVAYTRALDHYSSDPRTWHNRATCYVAQKLFRIGIRDYDEAIARASTVGELYYQRGVVYSYIKEYELAIQDYTSCLSYTADHADAWNNRGNAFRRLKEYQQAMSDLNTAVQLKPNATLYIRNINKVKQSIKQQQQQQHQQQQQQQQASTGTSQQELMNNMNDLQDKHSSQVSLSSTVRTPHLQVLTNLFLSSQHKRKSYSPATSGQDEVDSNQLPSAKRQRSHLRLVLNEDLYDSEETAVGADHDDNDNDNGDCSSPSPLSSASSLDSPSSSLPVISV